ncbi:transmembrane signal receptor [Lithospermum erythrorhizon]|uniref:Transmembrane signal receptor n=1 Tax=Lithospermum erythrorhizon TaxID=34254 RepID=A0AAV3RHH0_LITER
MIISVAAQRGWKVYQLDVMSAFLHGEISENVYVDQPKGYEKKGKEHQVYKLHKSLYGLKQTPRAWFSRIEKHFIKEGFIECASEHTLFTKTGSGGALIIVSLYVDDLIVTGDDEELLKQLKISMVNEFDMTDLGTMSCFLDYKPLSTPSVTGFKIDHDTDGKKIDDTYNEQLVGILMYLTGTKPNIMFATSLASRYMANPTELHLQVAKRILRYLKGILQYGFFYLRSSEQGELKVYIDSDYTGDVTDIRSTSEPLDEKDECTNVRCDNSSIIKLSKNPVMHGRCKHIDVRYHFLRNQVKEGAISLLHCSSAEQVADIITNALKIDSFQKLRAAQGIVELPEVS